MSKNKPYKNILLVRGKDEWYIQYQFEYPHIPGEFKWFKVRAGMNYAKGTDREKEAQFILKELKAWLKAGNSPFPEQHIQKQVVEVKEAAEKRKTKNWTISVAIQEFMKFVNAHGYTQRTRETYKCYVDDLQEWIVENGQTEILAYNYHEGHVLNFLDAFANNRDWSTRTYNNNLDFFGSFFNRCQKLEKRVDRSVRYQFDKDLTDLKLTSPQVNMPYTARIAEAIKKELMAPGRENLKRYIEWIYYSLMRPDEIRRLKVKDVDVVSRQIRIIGKTKDRIVPISDQLLKLVNRMQLSKYDLNDYVFGAAGATGPNRLGEAYFSELYQPIKDKLGLGPNYKIYSWKPTAIVNMIVAGFEDKAIMALSGHKTQKAFEAYKRDLIVDNSHLMKRNVLDF